MKDFSKKNSADLKNTKQTKSHKKKHRRAPPFSKKIYTKPILRHKNQQNTTKRTSTLTQTRTNTHTHTHTPRTYRHTNIKKKKKQLRIKQNLKTCKKTQKKTINQTNFKMY